MIEENIKPPWSENMRSGKKIFGFQGWRWKFFLKRVLPYPCYKFYLVSSDFYLLGAIREAFCGIKFKENEDVNLRERIFTDEIRNRCRCRKVGEDCIKARKKNIYFYLPVCLFRYWIFIVLSVFWTRATICNSGHSWTVNDKFSDIMFSFGWTSKLTR